MQKATKRMMILLLVAVVLFPFVLENALTPKALPPEDPDALWVSSEPNIWFIFDSKQGAIGQIVCNDEIIDVAMCMGPGRIFDMRLYSDDLTLDLLVRGSCNFSQDKGVVYVTKDIAGILGGVRKITFVRKDRWGTEGRQGDGSFALID